MLSYAPFRWTNLDIGSIFVAANLDSIAQGCRSCGGSRNGKGDCTFLIRLNMSYQTKTFFVDSTTDVVQIVATQRRDDFFAERINFG
ncbi:hypothetical protein Poly51_47940 [Rubripirellula tenax]|uniref:Uncharacterized protein n=1 Tax=Rubripirellula tenax TaxID=2528015 RepID=A0A5C6EK66_9BACT|nr:hypothetical protein Poly51_47940 [Rubripirellula tenax]